MRAYGIVTIVVHSQNKKEVSIHEQGGESCSSTKHFNFYFSAISLLNVNFEIDEDMINRV